jgi:hypothetical protein
MNWLIFHHRRATLAPAILLLGGLVTAFVWLSPPSPPAVTLKFLGYTNTGYNHVVLFEITNRSAADLEWSLHIECRPRDGYIVAVTEFMETNGVLTHVGGIAPMRLPGHNSFRFATAQLHPGDPIWLKTLPFPYTGPDRWREWISWRLYGHGWHRTAARVRPGTWVYGPALP